MKKEYIVYAGEKFTIEWYFDDNGTSAALEYFEDMEWERQKKTLLLFRRLGDVGEIFNKEKFRHEGDQVYALKPSQDRFLCFFFTGSKVIITNAYMKKTEKMPIREKERALKAKSDYTKRCKTGIYYD